MDFGEDVTYGYHFLSKEGGVVYAIRYSFLTALLLALIIYMIVRRIQLRKQGGNREV